jgi:hypothetical protein
MALKILSIIAVVGLLTPALACGCEYCMEAEGSDSCPCSQDKGPEDKDEADPCYCFISHHPSAVSPETPNALPEFTSVTEAPEPAPSASRIDNPNAQVPARQSRGSPPTYILTGSLLR